MWGVQSMECHGNLNARKMSHLAGQTRWREDVAVAPLVNAACGTGVMPLLQSLVPALSWHTFPSLACGWTLARDRHTITTYVWLTGATAGKHFARCSGCLRGP